MILYYRPLLNPIIGSSKKTLHLKIIKELGSASLAG
jgi:hypothetical protein